MNLVLTLYQEDTENTAAFSAILTLMVFGIVQPNIVATMLGTDT